MLRGTNFFPHQERIRERAAHALAMLCDSSEIQISLAKEGGVPPLVALLNSPNPATQESAARCCGLLASEHTPIQLALWHQKADELLAVLLGD